MTVSKHIVLLSDGTGNSASALFKTNVWRLYQMLDLSGPDAPVTPEQIAYYDDGVGTSSFKPLAMIGGAFGWGLKRNVIDLYTFLCRNYESGDEIYCFGFSRGAFTIRVLTGLIENQGLVHAGTEAELRRLATDAFRAYRADPDVGYTTTLGLEKPGRALRGCMIQAMRSMKGLKACEPSEEAARPSITFLGLWDTVAAYGLPIDELTRAWSAVFPLSTLNRQLCQNVKRACHALALDDERNTFHPVLWNEEGLPADKYHIQDETLSQVWFAGMHANVGGGYPDDALAYVSLDWIMGEAEHAGLRFKAGERDRVKTAVDSCGKLYDSRRGLGGTYRYLPRNLKTLTNDDHDKKNKVIIKRPKIHESVFERIQRGTDGYAPFVLPPHYAVVTAEGAIVDLGATPASGKLVEHATQAESRAKRQEEVWNLVWCKRVVYFASIFWVLALVAFPLVMSVRQQNPTS